MPAVGELEAAGGRHDEGSPLLSRANGGAGETTTCMRTSRQTRTMLVVCTITFCHVAGTSFMAAAFIQILGDVIRAQACSTISAESTDCSRIVQDTLACLRGWQNAFDVVACKQPSPCLTRDVSIANNTGALSASVLFPAQLG